MNSQITMNLENLRQKYSNLLIKYKAAVSDYINFLNNSPENTAFVSIQGQAFNGTGSAGQSNANTLQQCIASCSSLKACTGATFVSDKCMLRTGDSPVITSSSSSYAIIPKQKQLLLNMEDINTQLLSVNKELMNEIKVSQPVYDQTNKETYLKNKELIEAYEKLLEERRVIDETLNQYETLNNTENEQQIKVTQNYYSYILLFIIVVAIIFALYKLFTPTIITGSIIQRGGDLGISAYYIVFGVILFVIILRYSIN